MTNIRNMFPVSRRGFLQGSAALGVSASTGLLLGGQAQAQTPVRGGTLRMALAGGASADTLDPALASASVLFVMAHCWGDTLVESHPETGEALPSLAESWTASPDAVEWTFKIRKGVSFHDGKPLTVADAAATLRRHGDENSQSGALGLLSGIKQIEERGDDLVITLKEANADLPLVLTDYHLQIQPEGGVNDPNTAIGTGPYKLTSFEPGVRTTFERNTNDWRDDRGYVDHVEIIVMNDSTARISALSANQVDFINLVEPKVVPLVSRAPTVQILQSPGKGFYSFLMHCNTAPFDNNDLRLALKYAVDREALLKQVIGGYGSIGNDYPVNSNYALAPTDIEQRLYDPDKAAFHFKKSGHDGAILLRTSEAAFPGAVDAAQLFQQSAAKAGITLEVRREPSDGYFSEVWNKQPFCASYWGGRPTQDSRYSTSYVSNAEWNDTRFMRPDFDKMAIEARGELDEDKRRALYRDMALMIHDEGGLILPVFNDYVNAGTTKLKGYVHDIGNDISNGRIASRVWIEA
ncbi:ABC transporter substrate-binding protein [Aquamicrobium segne]|uniref:ABC transporter substrate-binding protein n=1 Tax=Aquamicrobium segne TaxID=469547 RepID=A0ABW0GU39_9HYPH